MTEEVTVDVAVEIETGPGIEVVMPTVVTLVTVVRHFDIVVEERATFAGTAEPVIHESIACLLSRNVT